MGRQLRGTTLTGKHIVAIAKLGRGMRPTEVAKEMGVDRGTINMWQKWPVFQERLAQYVDSLAKTELDRGLEDANFLLKEQLSSVILWMTDVVLGRTELKDPKRWRMALDLLHHAGLIDQQAVVKASAAPQTLNIGSLNQDRRQQLLAVGNEDIQKRLERFAPP